jgi:hypothetical protein
MVRLKFLFRQIFGPVEDLRFTVTVPSKTVETGAASVRRHDGESLNRPQREVKQM